MISAALDAYRRYGSFFRLVAKDEGEQIKEEMKE
jgi:hypothetical protein